MNTIISFNLTHLQYSKVTNVDSLFEVLSRGLIFIYDIKSIINFQASQRDCVTFLGKDRKFIYDDVLILTEIHCGTFPRKSIYVK